MLEKNKLYLIEPISLTITDEKTKKEITLNQDEIIKVLDFEGITVKIKRVKTGETFEVSKLGLEIATSKI